MLVGVFLRHFKIYKGARYIPFSINKTENFNLFIGQNGAGKSSILEALDSFFNNRDFIYNTHQNKFDAFIAPLFLIEKSSLKKFDKEVQKIIPIISEFFFNEVDVSNSKNYAPYNNFFDHRDCLKKYFDTHYLLLIGHSPNGDLIDNAFITFNRSVINKIRSENEDFKTDKELKKVLEKMKSNFSQIYSYQYIPVETSLNDFLRLESKGMQDLMSENIKQRIEKVLNEKLPIKEGRSQSKSLLDVVNNDLESFVENVAKTVQLIDEEYDFEKEYKAKTKLTANHLTDIIVDSFFSKRRLKKDGKPIENMSAGERKKALIDIAYAFLTQERKLSQNIILAIDEPESSLHVSMCYDQFNRLQRLAKEFNVQVFIKTHWYGALPIIDEGILHHIQSDKDITEIKPFSFSNYFAKQRQHPDDIQFKSYFDLVSSIISSLRLQDVNWIVVESEDDKKYICKHLKDEIKREVKFLPMGSCATVAVLYNYLHTPIEQGHDNNTFKGKIFCLIDTDIQGVKFSEKSDVGKIMRIRRLQSNNQKIELHHIDSTVHYPTEIEESLVPRAFYNALARCIHESNDETIKECFSKFKFYENAKNSYIKGDDSIIYLDPTQALVSGNPKHLKDKVHQFIDNNKSKICELYCEQEIVDKPKWIEGIEKYFE